MKRANPMHRFIPCVLVAAGLSGPAFAQKTYTLGLTFDDAVYETVPLKATLTKGNFDKLPTRVSYEAFCPPVMSQDEYNTCVVFATTYYMRTMLESIRRKQTGRPGNQPAFSPSYTYDKIKPVQDVDCREGCRLPDALFALKTYGAPRYESMPYPNCDKPGSRLDELAAPNKIGDVIRLFGKGANPVQKVLFVKKALSEGYPVVVGMHMPLSFFATRDVWEPAPGDVLKKDMSGHALCVVGYDDSRFGGAFRVINSWGTGWADKGLCWIRYNDLARFTPYAFQAFPDMTTPVPMTDLTAPAPSGMTGSVEFQLRDGLSMQAGQGMEKAITPTTGEPVSMGSQRMMYRISDTYPAGTAFKLLVNNSQQAYIYAIGTDTTYAMTRLFPYADGISPLLGPNTTVAYPSETKSIVLDNKAGTDYILVLFSRKPLNYERLVDQLQRLPGNLADRVARALKDELINWQSIRYRTDAVGFELDGAASGTVVPVLVALDHK